MIEIFVAIFQALTQQDVQPMLATPVLAAAALAVGAASAGVGAAAAAGAFTPKTPQRNLPKEVRETLEAAPAILEARKFYDPEYAQLQTEITAQSLFGREGAKDLAEGGTVAIQKRLGEEIGENERQILEKYGPEVYRFWRQNDPTAPLVGDITESARSQLALGSKLDPVLQNQLIQQTRAAAAARGFGTGISDLVMEAMTTGRAGEALRQQRQDYALRAAQLAATTTPEVMKMLLGREGTRASMMPHLAAVGGAASGQQALGNLFAWGQDIGGANQAARLVAWQANMERINALAGGAMNLGGGLMNYGLKGLGI